jgi:type IV secretion system protein VirB10
MEQPRVKVYHPMNWRIIANTSRYSMQRRLICAPPLLLLLVASIGLLNGQEAAKTSEETPKQSSKIVVPVNTTVPLTLKNAINSRTAFVGQAIYCETIYPVTVGNRIVIPVGSYVKGAVTQVVRPGRLKGKAQLGIRFESLTLVNGTTRPLRAVLASYAGSGNESFNREESKIEGEGSKGEDAGKIATTATQGTIIGGLSSRSGKGAGVGALSGGLGGLIWVLASRGKEIVLPPGTNLELQLASPLTFERDEIGASSRYDGGPALPSARGPNIDY